MTVLLSFLLAISLILLALYCVRGVLAWIVERPTPLEAAHQDARLTLLGRSRDLRNMAAQARKEITHENAR